MNSADSAPPQILKLTEEGHYVPQDYVLAWTWFAHHQEKSGTGLYIGIQWQQDGPRNRPYLLFCLGTHVFQIGWLWYDPLGTRGELS